MIVFTGPPRPRSEQEKTGLVLGETLTAPLPKGMGHTRVRDVDPTLLRRKSIAAMMRRRRRGRAAAILTNQAAGERFGT